MQLQAGQFYKLGLSVQVGHWFTDPFGACPRHHRLPQGTILYLEEVRQFNRPCGNGRYARFSLRYEGDEISFYVKVSRSGNGGVEYKAAHPLELLADAAE